LVEEYVNLTKEFIDLVYATAEMGQYEATLDSRLLSIGDSIASAYGTEGHNDNNNGYKTIDEHSYSYLVAKALDLDIDVVQNTEKDYPTFSEDSQYYTLAMDGIRAEDFLAVLDETYEPDAYFYENIVGTIEKHAGSVEQMRTDYEEAIAKSDIITVTMGGNNFGTYLGNQAEKYEKDGTLYPMDFSRYDATGTAQSLIDYLCENEQVLVKLLADNNIEINDEIYGAGEVLRVYATAFVYETLALYDASYKLLSKIRELNPNAQIVVIGLYNSLRDVYVEDYGIRFDASELTYAFTYLLDAQFAAYCALDPMATYVNAEGIELIGDSIPEEELSRNLLKGQFYEFMVGDFGVNSHPSIKGHEQLAERILNVVSQGKKYNITYHMNPEDLVDAEPGNTPDGNAITYVYDQESSLLDLEDDGWTIKGYEFKGWKDETDNYFYPVGNDYKEINNAHGSTDLYAVWETVPYTITYVNCVMPEGVRTEYNVTEGVTLDKPLTIPEYATFVNWTFNDENGEIVNNDSWLAGDLTGDVVVYANWANRKGLITPIITDASFIVDGEKLALSATVKDENLYSVTAEIKQYSGENELPTDTLLMNQVDYSHFSVTVDKKAGADKFSAIITVVDKDGNTVTYDTETKEQKDITDVESKIWCDFLDDENGTYTYTGKAIKPSLVVYYGTTKLSLNKDYTVSYKNNKNAGVATLTINGKGNFSFTKTVEFTIKKFDLNDPNNDVVVTAKDFVKYNKSNQNAGLTVKVNGKSISLKNIQYATVQNPEVKVSKVKEVGKYIVTAEAKDANYEGTVTFDCFEILPSDKILASSLSVTYTKKFAIEGLTKDTIKAGFTKVKSGKNVLTTGYTIEVEDIKVGTIKATIKGDNETVFGSKSFNITITGTKLNSKNITVDPSELVQIANGYVLATDAVKVTDGKGKNLVYLEDYTIEYPDQIKNGSGKVKIIGINDYTGTITKTFKINKIDINSLLNTIYVDGEVYYTKNGAKANVQIIDQGNELVLGKDYTLSFKNQNKAAGNMATVTIKGKGNYTGTVTKEYVIVKSELTTENISVNSVLYSKSKNAWKASVTVTDTSGKKLSKDKDYTLTYVNADGNEITDTTLPAGTAVKVKVEGINNYYGNGEVSYIIAAEKISKATVEKIADVKFNGKEQKPKLTVKVGETTLEEGKDYELTYAKNINVGTAKVTIKGLDNYYGTKTVSFKIVKDVNISIVDSIINWFKSIAD